MKKLDLERVSTTRVTARGKIDEYIHESLYEESRTLEKIL